MIGRLIQLPDFLRGWCLGLATSAALIVIWQACTALWYIPSYILPSPLSVVAALWTDRAILIPAFLTTAEITLISLFVAMIGGIALGSLLAQSATLERAFAPITVVLQVIPIVAVAPLLTIWVPSGLAMYICAFLVAFFPIVTNTLAGLRSVDRELVLLFRRYHASRVEIFLQLELISALPNILAALRATTGAALVGAIVAEFAAGSAGIGSGLAFRILEAQYRLNMPRMFACLMLLSLLGVSLFAAASRISDMSARRWRLDSARSS